MSAELYPLFLRLRGRPVLIVGAGSVALRKTKGLLGAGAAVTLLAPVPHPELSGLPVQFRQTTYDISILQAKPRWALIFAATDSPEINAAVQQEAFAAGIFCCRCDDPDEGDFLGGAMLQRSGVTLAVSTEGASPILAARLRDQAAQLDPILFAWAELLAKLRPRVRSAIADAAQRRALLQRLAGPEMESTLRQSGPAAAAALAESWLQGVA